MQLRIVICTVLMSKPWDLDSNVHNLKWGKYLAFRELFWPIPSQLWKIKFLKWVSCLVFKLFSKIKIKRSELPNK